MRHALYASIALALALPAWATPLKVRTSKGQQVIMCPDCSAKLACAKAGDFFIGFDADLENPKTGAATLAVHVQDKEKKPVKDAKVSVALSMPEHEHGSKPIALKHRGHGRYFAPARLVMPGGWRAEVSVTTSGGDTVKQVFSFSK
jgi:hypothetical protein